MILALPPAPVQEFATVQSIAHEPGMAAGAAVLADTDGDGALDVILALHQEDEEFARRLETWRAGKDGKLARAESLALTPDVVAFAHADVREGGGDELLLFNASGVFVWRAGPEARPERLLACDFLWQAADPRSVIPWQRGVLDLDEDGLVDLVLPEPGGFLVARQRRTDAGTVSFEPTSRVRVPPEPSSGIWSRFEERENAVEGERDNGSFRIGVRLGGGEESGAGRGGALVSVSERVPAPFWLDWDADADVDLLLQTEERLYVWLQEPSGFASDPQHSLVLPVGPDEHRELDASYSSNAVDLDLDGKADCVIFASDKRSDDVRTQGLFFAQGSAGAGPPLFGEKGRPSSLLVFAGFVSDPVFSDLDGDGYPELVLRTVRPDLIDQIRSASTESIDADLFVYRNRRGVLARQPDLTVRHTIALEDYDLTTEFLGDLTGDGLSELLVREEPERLRIRMLRAQGPHEKSTWSLVEKPLFELALDEKARLEIVRPEEGRPSLFVFEPTQVLWVRFR